MSESLHPALAQLATTCRKIISLYNGGRLSVEETRRQLAELVARDDDGVLWTLDAGGSWLRRTLAGEWVPGVPPSYGLLPPTPTELGGVLDPGSETYMIPVDEIAFAKPGSLVGLSRAKIENGGERSFIDGVRVIAMADRVLSSRFKHIKLKGRAWLSRRLGRS